MQRNFCYNYDLEQIGKYNGLIRYNNEQIILSREKKESNNSKLKDEQRTTVLIKLIISKLRNQYF